MSILNHEHDLDLVLELELGVFPPLDGGGRVERWCWVNLQCLGALLIWIRVGQGPTALAVGAGGVVWTFLSRLSLFFSFSLPLGDGLIWTEILSQRAVKPKTTNQPIPLRLCESFNLKENLTF